MSNKRELTQAEIETCFFTKSRLSRLSKEDLSKIADYRGLCTLHRMYKVDYIKVILNAQNLLGITKSTKHN